jgi:hypothetical protein
MSWGLRLVPRASRNLRRVPPHDADIIVERLNEAAIDPGQADLRKLAGCNDR